MSDEADALQRRMMTFVRAFGLHRPDETPCGAAVPVSEAHALAVLDEHGPVPQNRLARELGLTKSTVSRLVDQLERRGWAQRQVGDGDGRQRLVALTTEGAEAAQTIGGLRRERMRRLLDRVPETDRPGVLAALDALARAARDDEEDGR